MRSPGGFRLYTAEDAERVASMRRGMDQGLSAAEAARTALAAEAAAAGRPARGLLDDMGVRLLDAIGHYDEAAIQAVLDESFTAFGLEAVVRELILPTLIEVGDRWERGLLAVGHEHFASNLIRGRLLATARLWGRGAGPLALLACVAGEQHDISLMAFGLVLRSHGWRILFLGADTPIATLSAAAGESRPALTVLASFDAALLERQSTAVRALARRLPLALSGPGAAVELCERLGVQRLNGDLIAAAHQIAGGAGA